MTVGDNSHQPEERLLFEKVTERAEIIGPTVSQGRNALRTFLVEKNEYISGS